jgi:hypothetical protein
MNSIFFHLKNQHNMKFLPLFSIVLLCLLGCAKEQITEVENAVEDKVSTDLEQYFAPFQIPDILPRSNCYWTEIPAGSNNALADAIANACTGGIIYLKAGEHTQTGNVVIEKSVKIIGESGAVLKLDSELVPANSDGSVNINPAIHILNAPGTLIQDLTIIPSDGGGGTSILIEDSPYCGIMRNTINDFQFAVLNEQSDFTTIMLNNITMTNAWLTGEVTDALGITVVNGKSCYIADNEVSTAVFGIWGCDEFGTIERNYTHDSYLGVILCNVPPILIFPDGEVVGSEIPGAYYKVRNNKSENNFAYGYLVIDGANHNILENNEASNNGLYDIELTTDTYRFGFLTPAAYKNTVNVGAYPNVTIKNCGPDNVINGGVLVDTNADPCD